MNLPEHLRGLASERTCGDHLAAASTGNVADRLTAMAQLIPGAIAIAEPSGPDRPDGTARDYRLTTFRQLDHDSTAIAGGMNRWGIGPGMRLVMLVPFGTDFITAAFAILKTGAAAVLIDPGMDRRHLIKCLADVRPDGFYGIPKAQAIRTLMRHRFPTAQWNVTDGRRYFWGGKTVDQLREIGGQDDAPSDAISTDDPAAVIFTTGSTGPPKGVAYTHGTFHAQIDRIRDRYQIRRGSRDLACFPLFGLFDAVMGVTTIIPDMNPTRPADVDPPKLIRAAQQWEVDQSFGSPALWKTVTRWCDAHAVGRPFPTLRRVLSAGAPVPAATLELLRKYIHPEADVVTPYGATEALPIASIESREVIAETGPAADKGKGVCVGTRFEGVDWRIIEIDDGPIAQIEQTTALPHGKIGELIVAGPMVTREYVTRTDQNALHKITDGDRVWHRMGDVGYLDNQDRFWFCGRKAHRVVTADKTYFTIPIEAIFNRHPAVNRCALIGVRRGGELTPLLCVEPNDLSTGRSKTKRAELVENLLNLASRNPRTQSIDQFIIRDEPLPVDIRHNSKIFRERLTQQYSP